jgi:hypothetical protein
LSGFTHEPAGGGSPEWYTPPYIFAALGLQFDLDPCAPALPAASWIPATRRITSPTDGLAEPWSGRVWLNPPYGRETGRWLGKLSEHGDGVALVFARTDTPWFQSALELAAGVCFIRGRLNFIPPEGWRAADGGADSTAGAPSVLLAFGEQCARAVAASELGVTLPPLPSQMRLEAA